MHAALLGTGCLSCPVWRPACPSSCLLHPSMLTCNRPTPQAGALPTTLKLAAALPGSGSGSNSKAAGARAVPKTKRKELKEEVGGGGRMLGALH